MKQLQLFLMYFMAVSLSLFFYTSKSFAQKNNQSLNTVSAEDYEKITTDGAWCWFSDPRAIYVDGKMIGGFVDKEGSIQAFSYDPVTREKKQYKLYDKLEYDDHANPSVMQLPDKRVVIFFSKHGGGFDAPIYYAVSRKPADISSWEELQTVIPKMEGNRGICYTNPVMLPAEKNRTYLFFRGRNFKPTYIYTDDLKKWSDPLTVVINDTAYNDSGRPYMKVGSNRKDKIFLAFTDAHPRDRATNSIYFLMYKGGKYYGADGRLIAGATEEIRPIQADNVYDATKTFDKAWIWDVACDKNDNPVLVYARFKDGNNEHSYWYARWNGKAWENHMITKAGTYMLRSNLPKEQLEYECNYSGGVYLDHENPDIVYTSRPVNDVFEIEKWTFTGGNKSKWKQEAVTQGSARDNVRPFVVRNHLGNQPSVLWMYNYKYPRFKEYDCAIRVGQPAKGFDASFDKESIRKVGNALFDWQIRDSEEHPWGDNISRGWKYGILYNGMFDWSEMTGEKKYEEFLKKTLSGQSYQIGNRMHHADDFCVGQVCLDMYVKYQKDEMLNPIQARVDWLIKNPPAVKKDNTGNNRPLWWWCDALCMAPAVHSRLYAITGDVAYMEFAHREFLQTYDLLFDKDEHLFFRDAKFIPQREANGKKLFWSRGNGWVMTGLAEVLKTLPEKDKKYRPYYEALFKEMSACIVKLQAEDGFWRSSLLDPGNYPEPETSGTALNVYALAYGINKGYLPKNQYLPAVEKGWKALVSAVDTEGKLCWVQAVASSPGHTQKESTQVYAAGAVLMAACEIETLFNGK